MKDAISAHLIIEHLKFCLLNLDMGGLHAAAAHVDSAIHVLQFTAETAAIAPIIDLNLSVDFTYLDDMLTHMN